MRGTKVVRLGSLIAVALISVGCLHPQAPAPSHARASDPEDAERARTCQAPPGPAPRGNLPLNTAAPPDGETIASISIEGARTVPKALVGSALTMTPGSRFDSERADADVVRILGLGPFEDVRLLAERKPEGLALHVQLAERPLIRKVFLAKGTSQPEQGEWTPVLPGDLYDPLALERVVRVLERNLVAEGHLDAKAGVRSLRVGDAQVDVCLRIDRGEQWKIERFVFPGASVVRAEELSARIGTANQPGKPYRAEPLKIDLLRMSALHYERGLLQSKVGAPSLRRLPASHGLEISIPVEEGKVFRIGKVRVTGELAGPRASYERELGNLAGKVFVRSQIQQVIERLRMHHRKLARSSESDVVPSTALHEDRSTVDIDFRVEKR